MRPLHHPPARFETSDILDRFGLFLAGTHMRRKAELFENEGNIEEIIQTEIVPLKPTFSFPTRRKKSCRYHKKASYYSAQKGFERGPGNQGLSQWGQRKDESESPLPYDRLPSGG